MARADVAAPSPFWKRVNQIDVPALNSRVAVAVISQGLVSGKFVVTLIDKALERYRSFEALVTKTSFGWDSIVYAVNGAIIPDITIQWLEVFGELHMRVDNNSQSKTITVAGFYALNFVDV